MSIHTLRLSDPLLLKSTSSHLNKLLLCSGISQLILKLPKDRTPNFINVNKYARKYRWILLIHQNVFTFPSPCSFYLRAQMHRFAFSILYSINEAFVTFHLPHHNVNIKILLWFRLHAAITTQRVTLWECV